jgi:hypothetical protein
MMKQTMSKMWIAWVVAVMLTGFVLAACGTGGAETVATQVIPALEDVLPPDVALNIRNQVSAILGVPVETIQLESVEQTEWPNGCLGLPEPEEVCTEAITPGWSLAFTADGQEYRFRADQTGTVIRQEP